MKSLLTKSFGIDLRTLALFRICLGATLIADLVVRSGSMVAHYTDMGVLSTAEASIQNGGAFSFHLLSGAAWYQAALFILAGIFAFLFMLGYRTRLMTIASWVLLVSLDIRNHLILQSSDSLMVTLLFWSVFLPMGARFSVDSALNRQPIQSNTYSSIASAALVIQVLSVYFFGALLKTSDAWTPNGEAIYYALHFSAYASPLGVWFGQAPKALLEGLTYFVYYIELIGPLLILSPFFTAYFRAIIVPPLILMHIGFAFLLAVGIYPYLSITSLLVLIPGEFWDSMRSRIHSTERKGVKIYFDEHCDFCKKVCLIFRTFFLLPSTPIQPAQSEPAIYKLMEKHNSWVVEDYDGKRYLRWRAVTLVLSRSFLFFPLAWVFKPGVMQKLGDKLYSVIANNRMSLGKVSAKALPYLSFDTTSTRLSGVVVAIVMSMTFYLNLTNIKYLELQYPRLLTQVTGALFLQQTWTMFAPEPGKTTTWYFIGGKLLDGSTVDVYNNTFVAPVVQKPENTSGYFENYRWRKYFHVTDIQQHALKLARYYCYRWNSEHPSNTISLLTIQYLRENRKSGYHDGAEQWTYDQGKYGDIEC